MIHYLALCGVLGHEITGKSLQSEKRKKMMKRKKKRERKSASSAMDGRAREGFPFYREHSSFWLRFDLLVGVGRILSTGVFFLPTDCHFFFGGHYFNWARFQIGLGSGHNTITTT